MKLPIIIILLLSLNISIAQTPSISYQKVIGGNSSDRGKNMVELPNGDFVVCASSWSDASGDKTEGSYGKMDYWIYQMNPNGNMVWQLTLGGSEYDVPSSMIQTSDGGFLIIGNSNSPISGSKTSVAYGGYDVWLVKISANGALMWEKSYGGLADDSGLNLLELSSNKIVLATSSSSGIEGNKTKASKGSSDYWVIYVDSLGAIIDQFVYGGADNDIVRGVAIQNSNLIFSGTSYSNISGDKLENSYGGFDYWVVVTDLNGVIKRSKTIGGDQSELCYWVTANPNGTMSISGNSRSSVSGNKTSANNGAADYWVVNLDSNLNINWDVSLGGLDEEERDVTVMNYSAMNNTSIVSGSSKSGVSGNKTIGSFGKEDFWIVGLNDNGVKTFEFIAGGSDIDRCNRVIESSTGTLLALGNSYSGASGNKTEPNLGSDDVWLIELDFNLSVTTIASDLALDVYPVPAKTILNFSIPLKGVNSTITLSNMRGNVVYTSINGFGEDETIDVSSFPKGVYVLTVTSKEFRYTHKVVIE